MEGPVLRPFSYTKVPHKGGNFSFLEMATPIQTITLNLGIDQKEKQKTTTFFLNKQNKPSLKPPVFILMYSFVLCIAH
jgi:hypothetical protein